MLGCTRPSIANGRLWRTIAVCCNQESCTSWLGSITAFSDNMKLLSGQHLTYPLSTLSVCLCLLLCVLGHSFSKRATPCKYGGLQVWGTLVMAVMLSQAMLDLPALSFAEEVGLLLDQPQHSAAVCSQAFSFSAAQASTERQHDDNQNVPSRHGRLRNCCHRMKALHSWCRCLPASDTVLRTTQPICTEIPGMTSRLSNLLS